MSESFVTIPRNLAQASPYFISVAALCALLLTNNKWCSWFLVTYIVLGEGLNHLEKFAFKKALDPVDPWIRPNPPQSGCGIFNECSANGSKTFGFPSGHAQTTTFAAMFWSLYIYRQTKWSKTEKCLKIALLWILAGLVWYSRVAIGCHNWTQIAGGIAFGATLGAGSYMLIEKHAAFF